MTQGGGGVASFLALIRGCCGHTQHQARETVGSNQPFCFIMALVLAFSGHDLEVRGQEKGDSTKARLAKHPNMCISQSKGEKVLH